MGKLGQMRRGVMLFGIVLVIASLGAAVARAEGDTTTSTDTTTTDTTTTATTTTETTTTSTTTTTTTTVTTTTEKTTTTTAPTYEPLVGTRLPQGCIGAGFAAIAQPHSPIVALGLPDSGVGASEYPASRPFFTFDSGSATHSGCSTDRVTLRKVSLFGGAVTAGTVTATNGLGSVRRLKLDGSSVALESGQTIAVGSWGLLTRDAKDGRLSAPLALRLVHQHYSVPAGTTIYIAFAAQAKPSVVVRPHHHHHRSHPKAPPAVAQPLASTPKLGFKPKHYVFPIDSGASYMDTYGAGRNDIYDGWHHGDDLFAPLGTPVVAVANGTLTLVGWNSLGGWRLWLTDKKGNSFYYAHLAAYSRRILEHRRVVAGQVIGFLGRTGDAFTTPPHVHFEIHPHQFLSLGYDGAVNPTTYLDSWRVVTVPQSKIPPAARLQAPAGTPSQQATVVWSELLQARHLMPDGQPVVARTPSLRRPFPTEVLDASRVASSRFAGDLRGSSPWSLITLALALAALAAGSLFAVLHRRRSG